jgi:predicted RNase H-like HicB family nuclease
MRKIEAVIEKSVNNYSAFLTKHDGCIASGKTLQELKKNLEEALQLHIEGMKEDNEPIPVDLAGEYKIAYTFDVETFLSFYDKVFTRRALSGLTGINESLLSQYASGLKKPRPLQTKKIEVSMHRLGHELLELQF